MEHKAQVVHQAIHRIVHQAIDRIVHQAIHRIAHQVERQAIHQIVRQVNHLVKGLQQLKTKMIIQMEYIINNQQLLNSLIKTVRY